MTPPFEGFVGGVPFAALPGRVPADPGVYVVVWPHPAERPSFRLSSPAGRFKGKDPSVSVERLAEKWVDDETVIYIGKADARRRRRSGLAARLDEYRRFGTGENVAHWGGRLVWQIERSDELTVWWRAVDSPVTEERRMLAEFAVAHDGRLPFANLRR
ncbi:hypothetical protein [Mycobacteroides abscessus]|uniref:hypothetical protein n=1 Tax=Mycobacteroides abscessus TaxID=36809 RepID=UPI0005B39128|nr:hypothetical protein [Mycobacteroides abscessus]